MKKAAAAIVVFSAAAVVAFMALKPAESRRGRLVLSGTVEAVEVRLSFRFPGVLAGRAVSEGDAVRQGDEVARLVDAELVHEKDLRSAALAQLASGSRPEEIAQAESAARAAKAALDAALAGSRPQEIAQARAAVAAARAQLDALVAGSRPQEIEAARATVSAATAEVARWTSEEKRTENLSAGGVVSERDLESVRTARASAEARLVEARERLKLLEEGPRKETVDQARAALDQAGQALSLATEGPRKEAVEQLRAACEGSEAALELVRAGPRRETIDQARAALALAETRLADSVLRAPVGGVVLSHHAEAGEYAAPGVPVVTIGDLSRPWIRCWLEEPDLGRVRLGQEVRVTADSLPGRVFTGRVSFISSEAEFTPKNVQTREERSRLVFRMKVAVGNPDGLLKPGMPVDAEIDAPEAAR